MYKKKFEGDQYIIHINILYTYKYNVHDLIKHNNSLPRKYVDNCIVNDIYFDYHSWPVCDILRDLHLYSDNDK